MIKLCKRCGLEFETGEKVRRFYCDSCHREALKMSQRRIRMMLESVPCYRNARRAACRAYNKRARAFESRLLSTEEIEALNSACDAALARLRRARKTAREYLSEVTRFSPIPGKAQGKKGVSHAANA